MIDEVSHRFGFRAESFISVGHQTIPISHAVSDFILERENILMADWRANRKEGIVTATARQELRELMHSIFCYSLHPDLEDSVMKWAKAWMGKLASENPG